MLTAAPALSGQQRRPPGGGPDDRPARTAGRSWPCGLKIIRLGSAPRGRLIQVSPLARGPPAIAPITREVVPLAGKNTGSMTVAGVYPSTISVPGGACATAARAVAIYDRAARESMTPASDCSDQNEPARNTASTATVASRAGRPGASAGPANR